MPLSAGANSTAPGGAPRSVPGVARVRQLDLGRAVIGPLGQWLHRPLIANVPRRGMGGRGMGAMATPQATAFGRRISTLAIATLVALLALLAGPAL